MDGHRQHYPLAREGSLFQQHLELAFGEGHEVYARVVGGTGDRESLALQLGFVSGESYRTGLGQLHIPLGGAELGRGQHFAGGPRHLSGEARW